jgi:hypothetical protein
LSKAMSPIPVTTIFSKRLCTVKDRPPFRIRRVSCVIALEGTGNGTEVGCSRVAYGPYGTCEVASGIGYADDRSCLCLNHCGTESPTSMTATSGAASGFVCCRSVAVPCPAHPERAALGITP